MSRVLLCAGTQAEIPYFFNKALINVYSVEELCYCILKYAYLIDKEIMDGRMSEWIGKECGISELSLRLGEMEKKGRSVGEYVVFFLREIGYGREEQLIQAQEELESGASQSVYEKKKLRGDYLVENRRYALALKMYEPLLSELPNHERELAAGLCHNRGVAYAGLFLFENAAESFKQAYEYDSSEESYIQYLAASRMYMNETEYVDFVAGNAPDYDLTLRVEKLLEEAGNEFEGSQERRMLFTLKVCKEEKNTVSYYEEMERITNELKEEYRQIVAE